MLLGTLVNENVACRIVTAGDKVRVVGGMSVPNRGVHT